MLLNKDDIAWSKIDKSSQSFEMASPILCNEMYPNPRKTDEIESLSGTFTFGLLKQERIYIKKNNHPIVFICNGS